MSTTIYYLEQTDPTQIKGKTLPSEITVSEVTKHQAESSLAFYTEVGKHWQWTDKLSWSQQQWQNYTSGEQLKTYAAYLGSEFVGYFELEKHADNSVEIAYFGLSKAFLGKGLGGGLLTRCIETAWQWPTHRVWVHTCDLDHPSALANYKARGMSLYKTEQED
ncbi:N-acetyltransferase [Agarivorans sp. Toyoura001]|uniref:GNAT family N-acetyltransferase n=1 Tax=Agarivorans sp. Toyoura001 TaxID=2283141 RepID=UPI0010E849B3|nr:GNAT family N-acetyltransferase [Agarivorans sp. Toyoura001]GDY24252.1 N-acetyltransferase [Agarivorans sp. Toyoura001]